MAEPQRPKRNFELGDSFVIALCVAGAAACAYLRGWEGIRHALGFSVELMVEIAPMMALSLLLAGFVQLLVPEEKVSRWLGAESGWRGLALATLAGALVPGGPWTSFPLLVALAAAGADIGALVAFLTAWEVLAVSRAIVWELPFMGPEFTAIRFAASIPIALAAGFLARRIPLKFTPPSIGKAGP